MFILVDFKIIFDKRYFFLDLKIIERVFEENLFLGIWNSLELYCFFFLKG